MIKDEQRMEEFFEKNREKFKNPLLKQFLSDSDNMALVRKAVLEPSDVNKGKVDEAFRETFVRVARIKYISSLIHYSSIDFDRKHRKDKERMRVVLDAELPGEGNLTPKDLITDENVLSEDATTKTLLDAVANESLACALRELSERQLEILEMVYLKELPLKDIAHLLKTSPQNVSNLHRKALKKLHKLLVGKERAE